MRAVSLRATLSRFVLGVLLVAGILSFCPMRTRSLLKLFARLIALTVTPWRSAMCPSVSPFETVCVIAELSAVVDMCLGIWSFWPMRTISLLRLLACLSALTVVPW